MTKTCKALPLILALGTAAGAAQAAGTIDLHYLSTDGITVTTSKTEMGYLTGALQLTSSSAAASFEAYCVEIMQGHATTAAGFQSYTVGSFTAQQSSLLQGLYSSTYASVSTAQDKAAFQTAIWEIMEEPAAAALNVKNGSFEYLYLSETSSTVDDAAFAEHVNAYLLAASSYQGEAKYTLNKLVNASYQDFVTVSAVPEPESYAMLLAGLCAVGYVVRRRKAP